MALAKLFVALLPFEAVAFHGTGSKAFERRAQATALAASPSHTVLCLLMHVRTVGSLV